MTSSASRHKVREQIGSGNVPTLTLPTRLADALVSIFAIRLTRDVLSSTWSHESRGHRHAPLAA